MGMLTQKKRSGLRPFGAQELVYHNRGTSVNCRLSLARSGICRSFAFHLSYRGRICAARHFPAGSRPPSTTAPGRLGPCSDITNKKALLITRMNRAFLREAGIYLFSQAVSSQLSSAQVSLTSVFGMGTGVASQPLPPEILNLVLRKYLHNCIGILLRKYSKSFCFDQALGLLVPVSYMHCCTSTPGLSTL